MSLDRRCQLCGTVLKNGRLVLDHYFWLKSATGDEIEHFSERCSWCAVLKELYFECLTAKERSARGVLEWGNSFFEPVWRSDGGNVELEIFSTDKSNPVDGIPVKALVPQSTSSTSSFTQALRWIKYCDALHNCCSDESGHVLPKRLLDIGMNKSRFAQRVKLIETTGTERPYACLSHCWGTGSSTCVTTKANYKENLKGIPSEGLAQTFQDAVIFARKLQIRYLWIDSLCIVQDDKLDWASESGKMSSIYEGGYVTIAATSSTDSMGGLFYDNSTGLYDGHARALQTSDDILVDGKVVFRRKLPHFSDLHVSKSSRKGEAAATYPLLGRAWVLQERLLSPRVIHFARHELIWECREASGCQCLQEGEPFYPENSSPVTSSKIDLKRERFMPIRCVSVALPISSDEHIDRMTRWHHVVVEYSKLGLTVHTDKLPALSGLAQHFQSKNETTESYLAGMWESQLGYDLVWMSANGASTAPPPTRRAPSWSWASVDGEINYPWNSSDPRHMFSQVPSKASFIDVLGVHVSLLSHDPYGQLASGALQVVSRLVHATVTYSAGPAPEFNLNVQGGLVTKFYVDYALHAPNEEHHVSSGEDLRCLRVVQYFPQEHVLSLVLKRVEPDIAVYRRIGLAVEICTLEEIEAIKTASIQAAGSSPPPGGMAEVVTII